MEHDFEGIPFDLQFAEKQVWGKVFHWNSMRMYDLCAKESERARTKKERKRKQREKEEKVEENKEKS